MGWRDRRLKRLLNRRAYTIEVSEFFADLLMMPGQDPAVAGRCRLRLDDLDDEAMYLESAILRLQRRTPGG